MDELDSPLHAEGHIFTYDAENFIQQKTYFSLLHRRDMGHFSEKSAEG